MEAKPAFGGSAAHLHLASVDDNGNQFVIGGGLGEVHQHVVLEAGVPMNGADGELDSPNDTVSLSWVISASAACRNGCALDQPWAMSSHRIAELRGFIVL